MGMPAARTADQTSHGTPLSPGPGSVTVLLGGMPAWRVGSDSPFHLAASPARALVFAVFIIDEVQAVAVIEPPFTLPVRIRVNRQCGFVRFVFSSQAQCVSAATTAQIQWRCSLTAGTALLAHGVQLATGGIDTAMEMPTTSNKPVGTQS